MRFKIGDKVLLISVPKWICREVSREISGKSGTIIESCPQQIPTCWVVKIDENEHCHHVRERWFSKAPENGEQLLFEFMNEVT